MKITVLLPSKDLIKTPKNHTFYFLHLNENSEDAINEIKQAIHSTDIFLNLYDYSNQCGQDIVNYLYNSEIPYTGVNPNMYDPTRQTLKDICRQCNILTPKYQFVNSNEPINLTFPLFVKPSLGYSSVGITEKSKVNNHEELKKQLNKSLDTFSSLLVEEFIDGREFSVLVSGSPTNTIAFDPVEYVFKNEINFLTEEQKNQEDVYWYEPCRSKKICDEVKKIGKRLFAGFECTGYVRIDIRMNRNRYYVIDINPYCSLFNGGTADKILECSEWSSEQFLDHIIEVGMNRKSLSAVSSTAFSKII